MSSNTLSQFVPDEMDAMNDLDDVAIDDDDDEKLPPIRVCVAAGLNCDFRQAKLEAPEPKLHEDPQSEEGDAAHDDG